MALLKLKQSLADLLYSAANKLDTTQTLSTTEKDQSQELEINGDLSKIENMDQFSAKNNNSPDVQLIETQAQIDERAKILKVNMEELNKQDKKLETLEGSIGSLRNVIGEKYQTPSATKIESQNSNISNDPPTDNNLIDPEMRAALDKLNGIMKTRRNRLEMDKIFKRGGNPTDSLQMEVQNSKELLDAFAEDDQTSSTTNIGSQNPNISNDSSTVKNQLSATDISIDNKLLQLNAQLDELGKIFEGNDGKFIEMGEKCLKLDETFSSLSTGAEDFENTAKALNEKSERKTRFFKFWK